MTVLAARPIGPAGAWHRQLALFAGAYVAYSIGRYAALGDQLVALENARWIVDLEDSVALDLEPSVQRALLDTAWVRLANHVYLAAQFVVVPGALVWLYRHSRAHYRLLRDTVLLAWLISLPIHALFPVAPPRLADVGLIDTISAQTGVALDSRFATSVYNPLAAVPSLHAGFALAISAVAYRAARTTVVLVAAFTWTAAVAVAVVATGNHFVFDIAAGWIVTAASGGLVLLARRAAVDRSASRRQSQRRRSLGTLGGRT